MLKASICSTDLHSGNVHGAARNLPWVTAKLLHLGQLFLKHSFFFGKIEFENVIEYRNASGGSFEGGH